MAGPLFVDSYVDIFFLFNGDPVIAYSSRRNGFVDIVHGIVVAISHLGSSIRAY